MYLGDDKTAPVTISRIGYSSREYLPSCVVGVNECRPDSQHDGVAWYTVDGVHDVDLLQKIGANFGLHPLVIEDISNTTQRPKLEWFDSYFFIAAKMITCQSRGAKIRSEHVSIVGGQGFVLLFLEDPGDLFAPVRQRIEAGKGAIRSRGADYLVYALVDAIVDYYFPVIEEMGEHIERLEEEVVTSPSATTLRGIHRMKREVISLRRSIWPMREVVNSLTRDESPFVGAEVKIFLRDLYDHTVHVIDTIETMRDIITGTQDVYLSSVSNRLNEVMKVLTVMSSIFIPLTFIVGVYGMNFRFMPELESRWGYPTVWLVMVLLSLGLLTLFRRKKWL